MCNERVFFSRGRLAWNLSGDSYFDTEKGFKGLRPLFLGAELTGGIQEDSSLNAAQRGEALRKPHFFRHGLVLSTP